MGTPLKSLKLFLSPQVITPLLRCSAKRIIKTTPRRISSKNIPKKLDFFENTTEQLENSNNTVKSDVRIEVTNCSPENRKYLMVNTPNKLKIQQYGLQDSKQYFNILGRGTFGTVVSGHYKGKEVAVKVVRTTKPIQEKNILELTHENVVNVIDIIINTRLDYAIIVLEYLGTNSLTLQELLDDENLVLKEYQLREIAVDICNGLKFCHENSILHLDVKPSNVLLSSRKGIAKLCDFGNSVRIGDLQKFQHYGTVIYTAPEILTGNLPTVKCDIYSVGVLLWQMETREIPYSNLENKEIVIYKVVKFALRPKIPEDKLQNGLSELYEKCWSQKPEERPTINLVIEILKEL